MKTILLLRFDFFKTVIFTVGFPAWGNIEKKASQILATEYLGM